MINLTLFFANEIDLTDADVTKAQLGLGHSFSRSKCAQDVNRQDKPIT